MFSAIFTKEASSFSLKVEAFQKMRSTLKGGKFFAVKEGSIEKRAKTENGKIAAPYASA